MPAPENEFNLILKQPHDLRSDREFSVDPLFAYVRIQQASSSSVDPCQWIMSYGFSYRYLQCIRCGVISVRKFND